MKRALRMVAGFAAALALAMFGLDAAAHLESVQGFLRAKAQAELGPGVHFEHVSPDFWPGLGVALEHVRIEGAEAGGVDLLRAREVGLVFRWSALLEGRVELGELTFEGAAVHLVVAPDGSLDGLGVVASLVGDVGESGGPGEVQAGGDTAAAPLELPAISATGSSIHIVMAGVDAAAQRGFTLDDLELDLDAARPGTWGSFHGAFALGEGRASISGRLRPGAGNRSWLAAEVEVKVEASGLPAADALPELLPGPAPTKALGKVDLQAEFAGRFEDLRGSLEVSLASGGRLHWIGLGLEAPVRFRSELSLKGDALELSAASVDAAALSFAGLRGTKLSIAMRYANDRLEFSKVEVSLYAGSLAGSGHVDLDDPLRYRAKAKLDGVSMKALLADLAPDEAAQKEPEVGFDSLAAEVSALGTRLDPEDAFAGMQGSGSLRLAGGTIPKASIVGSVGSALLGFVPSILKPKKKLVSVSPTEIDHLTASFVLADSSFEVSALEFVTSDYTLNGGGKVSVAGALNLSTQIHFTSEGMQTLLFATAIPLPTGELDLLPGFPVQVRGSLEDPVFYPEIQKLPTLAVQLLFSPLRGIGKALFGGSPTPTDAN